MGDVLYHFLLEGPRASDKHTCARRGEARAPNGYTKAPSAPLSSVASRAAASPEYLAPRSPMQNFLRFHHISSIPHEGT